MSAGRKAIGWAVAGILVVAAAGVGYSVLRPKNDPQIIGALPKGLRFMPRSQFKTKPWFSLPWFGGKRLTYPTNTTMPKGFKDEPDLAGILTWDPPTPVVGSTISPTASSSISNLMPIYFGLASWKDESGKVWEQKTAREFYGNLDWSAHYAKIPYVYGDRAKRFEVTWFDLTPMATSSLVTEPPRVSMTVELPANHRPAPREKPQDIKVGKWTVHLEPQSQLGPTFARQYVASISEARAGEVFFLDIHDQGNGSYAIVPGLRCERGKVTRLTLPAKAQVVFLRLEKVAEKPVDLRVKGLKSVGPVYSTFRATIPGSSHKVFGYQISGLVYFLPDPPGEILECRLAGSQSRMNRTFGLTSMETMSRGKDTGVQRAPLKEGELLHCTVAWRGETATSKLKL